jgi:alkylation response protein AidB-like acyl-CoA dehydrogenase
MSDLHTPAPAAIDRHELRAAAREILDDPSGPEAVRARVAGSSADPLWPRLVAVGWSGIDVPEDLGGAGAGFGDLAVVLVEAGGHLAPSSLFASVLASGALQANPSAATRRWLPALAAVSALLDRAAVALAADSLGIAGTVLAMTVEYVSQREQFDRPIGSFQAVKHRCTDMLIAVETARLIVEEAADRPEDAVSASRAKSYATDAAETVAATSVQLHGGIGVTWEHDAHLYLKRANLNQVLYGDARRHRRRLADLMLGPELAR